MLNSRHIRQLASVLPSCILVVAVSLMLTSLSAKAASLHADAVTFNSGASIVSHTAGVVVQSPATTGLTSMTMALASFYGFLHDPDVVFLLFVVAMMGLFLEISHPGTFLPGIVGALSLLLFLFAASSLALNWAGLALMVLSFVLLILDVKLPAHGVLTVGSVVSLIVGTSIFFNTGATYGGQQIHPWLIYTMGAVVGVIGFVLMTFVLRAQRRPVLNGAEGMIGAIVVAITALIPEGRVNYFGENWSAILDVPGLSVRAGTELQVVSVQGLCLCVRPLHTTTRPVANID